MLKNVKNEIEKALEKSKRLRVLHILVLQDISERYENTKISKIANILTLDIIFRSDMHPNEFITYLNEIEKKYNKLVEDVREAK